MGILFAKFYELFLLLFRAQTDNPHCQFTFPFLLQCYPQIIRNRDISLAYSSPNQPKLIWAANSFTMCCSLYTGFPVYLMTIGRQYLYLFSVLIFVTRRREYDLLRKWIFV